MDKTEKIVFESKKNSIDFLYDDKNISIVSLDLMHEDEDLNCSNRNMCNFSHDSILKSLNTFYNKPIIFRYNSEVDEAVTDVTSHAKSEKERLQTRIGGHIPTDARFKFVEKDNGKTYFNIEAILQKKYVPQLMDILKDKDGNIDLSIEVEVTDGYQNEDNGIFIINDFILNGICLLGTGVEPGIEGAHMEVITFEKDNVIEKLNQKYINFSKKQESIIEKIKYKENFEKGGKMEHRELEHKLWQNLSQKTFVRGKELMQKYYIEAIYDTHIIAHDNEKEEYVKLKYHIDKDGNVEVDYTSEKPIEEDLKVFDLVYAKEDIGTKPAIKINKKELKETPWGQIDKAELRKRVIEAKNFKQIADEIFLDLRDKWDEGVQSALKYPVMEIIDDTAYYNRGALTSAKGYAEKNNEEEVLDKLKKIYKSLDLEFEVKEDNPKAMMSDEEFNKITKYEDKDMECGDKEDFEDKEENKDKDEIKEPDAGAQKDKDEKDAKDDEEVRKDDVKKEVEMSTDAHVDPVAAETIEEKQAEDNKELADEGNESVAKLKEELEGLNKELEQLRNFKKEVEDKEKDFKVTTLINSIKEVIPEDVKEEFVNKAKEYSLSDIGEWENMVKAKAFEYTNKNKTNVAPKYTKMSIWGNEVKSTPEKKGLWDGLI